MINIEKNINRILSEYTDYYVGSLKSKVDNIVNTSIVYQLDTKVIQPINTDIWFECCSRIIINVPTP